MQKEKKAISPALITLFMLCGGICGVAFLNAQKQERINERTRLKYYKKSYRRNFWGQYPIWTEREIPLTDEQVDELIKATKLLY